MAIFSEIRVSEKKKNNSYTPGREKRLWHENERCGYANVILHEVLHNVPLLLIINVNSRETHKRRAKAVYVAYSKL